MSDDPNRSAIVVSVHGIRTRGKWQKELVPFLNRAGYHSSPVDYGYFWALFLLFPSARRRKIDWFRDEYLTRTAGYPRQFIIAHSFGTYIVAERSKSTQNFDVSGSSCVAPSYGATSPGTCLREGPR